MSVLRDDFKSLLYGQRRLLLLTWAAFFAALCFYLWIPEIAPQNLPHPANYPHVGQMRDALWLIAILTAVFLLWVKSHFHTVDAIFRDSTQPMEITDLEGDTAAEKDAARLVSFYPVENDRRLFCFPHDCYSWPGPRSHGPLHLRPASVFLH
jgi:hypothetical protein